MADEMKLGIVVDTDTRATRAEFSALRREIKREAENMEGDWEAAGRKIEDALREAGARDDLIDAAKRIGREGPSEVEKMQRALRDVDDTARSTADAVDDAARDISESFEDNSLTADDVFGAELKAEVVQNAAEAGAEVARGLKDGFDSEDVETIVDGISDTIVAVGTLGGPIGTAGGLAAASAMNLMVGPAIEQAKKDAEQYQSTFTDAFSNIVEAGAEMGRELAISNSTNEFSQDAEKMAAANEAAAQTGLRVGVVLRAMAGDTDALNLLNERAASITDDLAQKQADLAAQQFKTTEEQVAAGQAITELGADMSELDSAVGKVTGTYETNTDALNAATEAAAAKADADAYATQKATEQALATAKSTGEAEIFTAVIDGATRKLAAMPDGKVVEVTDDGTVTATQVAIDNIKGKTVEVPLVPVYQQDQFQRMYDMAIRGITPKGVDVWAQLGVRRPV